MALKSLELTAAEAKEQDGCCSPNEDDPDAPKYPWGTSLSFGDEALAKLGIGLMPVGTEVTIIAKGVVTGTSSRDRQAGGQTQDMDVQLTAVDLTAAQADRMGASASRLYPSN